MLTKYLLVAVIAVCLFNSCKKKSGTDSSGTPDKLKMYIENATTAGLNQVDSFAVAYDGNNRITSLASPALTFNYAYSSNSFTLNLYNFSQLSIHEIAYINSSSLVDSTFQFDNTNDTTTEGYTYAGGLLTRMMTYNYSSAGSTIYSEDDYTYDNFYVHYLPAQRKDQSHLLSCRVQVLASHTEADGWVRQFAWNDHLFLCFRQFR